MKSFFEFSNDEMFNNWLISESLVLERELHKLMLNSGFDFLAYTKGNHTNYTFMGTYVTVVRNPRNASHNLNNIVQDAWKHWRDNVSDKLDKGYITAEKAQEAFKAASELARRQNRPDPTAGVMMPTAPVNNQKRKAG